MYAGGAHGTKGHEALNLQIPMLREIRIEDLVRTDPDAHQKLITLCDSALRASPTDGDDKIVSMGDAFGSGADIRFKTFLIRQSGLTFTFKSELPHVIADVVAPHVTWAALGPLMHDRGRAMVPGPSEPFTEAEAPWGPWDARAEEDGLAEVPAE
jgi:hypothetical protein